MNHVIHRISISCVLILFMVLLSKLIWIEINALYAERSFWYQWRIGGGLKGFLHLASDLELASDSDRVIREHAAGRLSTKRCCDQEDGIIELLKNSRERSMVEVNLMRALAVCRSQKAVPLFRKYLREQEPSMTIVAAAQSLGVVQAREAIPDLEAVLEQSSDRCVQCAGNAAVTLSRMGERRVAYPWAIKVLSADNSQRNPGSSEDFWRRSLAGDVIANLGTAADIPLLEKNKRFLRVMADYHKKKILDRESKR